MRQLTHLTIAVAAMAAVSLPVHATIISTSVEGSITIAQSSPSVLSATDSDTGILSAFASVAGPSGSSGSVDLEFDSLTAETANLDFDISWDGGTIQNGSMNAPSIATINYTAVIDSVLDYTWDFGYSGANPFGLQLVRIQNGISELETLGNSGSVSSHSGSGIFNLVAGNSYTFGVRFNPNVGGGVGDLGGTLAGDVSFQFNGATVPEPATLLLTSLGLFGLGFKRSKRFQ